MLFGLAEKTICFGRVVAIYSFYFVHVDGNFIFASFAVIRNLPSVSLYVLALPTCPHPYTHIHTSHQTHNMYTYAYI